MFECNIGTLNVPFVQRSPERRSNQGDHLGYDAAHTTPCLWIFTILLIQSVSATRASFNIHFSMHGMNGNTLNFTPCCSQLPIMYALANRIDIPTLALVVRQLKHSESHMSSWMVMLFHSSLYKHLDIRSINSRSFCFTLDWQGLATVVRCITHLCMFSMWWFTFSQNL